MSHKIAFLAIQLGLIIFLAKFFGKLAERFHIPSVMGELLAGILFGPYCLGCIPLPFAGMAQGIFPLQATEAGIPLDPVLYSIATLGSIVLLFLSGIETDVRTFFRYSVAGTVVGIGGIVFSFLCGAAVGMFALHWDFMDPRCLFLGILCTATSVGISARILSEHHAMDTPEGVTIMAAAVIDDVLGIVCLAVVVGIAAVELHGGSMAWGEIGWITLRSFGVWLGITAIGLLFSKQLSAFLKQFKSASAIAIMALGMALILAGFFEQAGLAMIVGAFVMGLSLSKTDIAFKIRARMTPVYQFLVPIFFVVMGMLVDIRVLADPHVLGIGILFAIMATIGKVVGCFIPAFCMNFNALGALRIGVGMVPRCEVVLIIAGIAATTMMKNPALAENAAQAGTMLREVPIFDSRLFGIAIIMPLFTALLAPPLLNMTLNRKGKGIRKEVNDQTMIQTEFSFTSDAVALSVLHELLEQITQEGFLYSAITKEIRLIQFRRDDLRFSLQLEGKRMIFTSDEKEVSLINALVYESVVEIHRNLSELRSLTRPDVLRLQMQTPLLQKHKRHSVVDNALDRNRILLPLKSADMTGAIRELLSAAHACDSRLDAELCYQDILTREQVVSTYQGDGIAMPHARTLGTKEFIAVFGIKPEGILCNDGNRARLVLLSLCPKDEPGPYLEFISHVAQVLSQENLQEKILTATSKEEILKVLRS